MQEPLGKMYPEVYSGSNDASNFFLTLGSQLLKRRAILGMIVARYWIEAYFTDKLRNVLTKYVHPTLIVDFGNLQVWPEVNVLTIINFFEKSSVEHVVVYSADERQVSSAYEFFEQISDFDHKPLSVDSREFGRDPWYLRAIKDAAMWRKVREQTVTLDEITDNTQGIKTGNNNVFTVSKETVQEFGLEPEVLVPVAEAQNVQRYTLQADEFVIYTDGSFDISEKPAVESYLSQFEEILADRAECNRGLYPWWRLQRPRNRNKLLSGERILVPLYATKNRFSYSRETVVGMTDVYIIFPTEKNYRAPFLSTVLNSRLLTRYHETFCKVKRAGYLEYSGNTISDLPVPRISFTTLEPERRNAVEEATKLYEAGSYAAVAELAEQELAWMSEAGHSGKGRNDTVHDLLAHLAEKMTTMHEERVEMERAWREWVEALLPPNHKLTKTFLERGWVEAGLREGWSGVLAGFQAKKAVPGAKDLQKLKRETEQALGELRPLYERIRSTDELIDQIVYRLYGLTEEEIQLVEGSKKPGPTAS